MEQLKEEFFNCEFSLISATHPVEFEIYNIKNALLIFIVFHVHLFSLVSQSLLDEDFKVFRFNVLMNVIGFNYSLVIHESLDSLLLHKLFNIKWSNRISYDFFVFLQLNVCKVVIESSFAHSTVTTFSTRLWDLYLLNNLASLLNHQSFLIYELLNPYVWVFKLCW